MAFEYLNGLRWFPVVASVANLAAFIVALKILLNGISGRSNAENATTITYDTSFIGQDPQHYPAALAANVTSLVPTSTLGSVTQYLGIADWYSIGYLVACQGSFAVDPSTNLPTSTKTNLTCSTQNLGYTFSLHDTLLSQLNPSVKGVLSDLPSNLANQDTMPGAALLTLGLVLAGINLVVMAVTIYGRFHISLHPFIAGVLTMLAFIVSSAYETDAGRTVAGTGLGWLGTQYLAMTWAIVGLEALVVILTRLEWRLDFLHAPRRAHNPLLEAARGELLAVVEEEPGTVPERCCSK